MDAMTLGRTTETVAPGREIRIAAPGTMVDMTVTDTSVSNPLGGDL